MALKKLVPAGGQWNTPATWEPEGVPTAADDVEVTTASNGTTLTLKTTIGKCRSLVFQTGWTGTFKREITIEVGTSTAAPENIILKLASTMTLSTGGGNFELKSTTNN